MPPVVTRTVQHREPTLFEKIKMGAIMGSSVGAVIGVVVGSMAIYQTGPGPNGYMRTIGQYVAGSTSMLGLFMAVGSVIRSDDGLEGARPLRYGQGTLRLASSAPSPVQWQERFRSDLD